MKFNYLFFGLLLFLFTSQAFATISTSNLVAYYKFDETSGVLIDYVGGDNNGTNTSVTYSQSGKINNSYLFTSPTSYTTLANNGFPSGNNNWTFNMWIYDINNVENGYLYYQGNNNPSQDIRISHSPSTKTITVGSYGGDCTSVATIDFNTWGMLTVDYNQSYFNVYVNGVLSNSCTRSSLNIQKTNPRFAYSPSGAKYGGRIDETSIWTRNLTSAEILELYNDGLGTTYTNGSFVSPISIEVDFNYVIRKDLNKIILTDTSVANYVSKTAWTWTNNGSTISTAQDYNLTATELTDYNICLHVDTNVSDVNGYKCYSFNTGEWTPPVTTFTSSQYAGTTINKLTFTCTDNNSGCKYLNYNIDSNVWLQVENTGTIDINYSGAGSHSIQYFSTDNSDNNETIKTSTFTTYGNARFNFIDENTYAPVTTTYTITPSINGVSTGTGTSVDLNLQGITNTTYTFTFNKTGYGTRYYYTDLNEFSSFDYNQLMLQDTNGNNEVDLTIYTYNGTTILPNTPITITKNNYLVGRYLTDSTGTINPFLKDQDVNYLFNVEGYYNLGQVAILFNRPKWDTNLGDIAGTWQITLTSPQSTTRYLITTNSQKIAILPNTVEDYSAKVCMYRTSNCNTDYISRTFLLSYKGNLGETLIQPYLNLVSASTLRTLKVLNYGTAQPYPDAKLEIRTKTEAGVDYLVESVITDSTGLATTYLNDAQTYYITANDVTVYNVTPNDTVTTYYIYFNYINLPSSTINPIDVNISNDTNTLFGQVYGVRNALFTSCTRQNDCFPAAFFSILITFLILISVTNMTQANNPVGIKGLALVAFCSLTIFFGIGWLPVYIYAFLGAISMLLVVIVQ